MDHHITVSFGPDREYNFHVPGDEAADLAQEQARAWVEEQFAGLEPDLPSPLGKMLLADKLVVIVRAYGEHPFAARTEWARQFARCAGRSVGKPNLTVDVAQNNIGF